MLLKLLFHLIGAITFGFACYYDWNYVIIPAEVHRIGTNFAGKLKFLTYWDAIIQTTYFALCVVADIINWNKLQKFRHHLFATISFPLSLIVGVTFWLLYAIDRELVFPRAIDAYFPLWLNHLMHTNIMIFAIVEMYITKRNYPKRMTGIKTLTGFMLTYLVWMNFIYLMSGNWVYPIFDVLNLPGKIGFYLAMLIFSIGMYLIGEMMNWIIWRSHHTVDDERSNYVASKRS